jgi:hypothetical protein
MGENVIDLELGSGIDISDLKKGLSEAEQEYIKYASKVFETIEKNAQEQTAAIRKEETEKLAIIKKSRDEQIQAIKDAKDTDGLSGAERQKKLQAVREAAAAETRVVKNEAKVQEAAVKSMAAAQTKTIQEQAKKQLKAIRDGYKSSGQAIKDFAKGAAGALVGLDQVLASLAGGPAAIGKLVVDMGRKAVAALNEMAEAWRQQEKVEVALANAAKNNPYLNDRNVKQLKTFANEMQRATGIDSVQIMQTETRLASLNRNQDQMQKIIKTAANMAAAGVMDFDSAVMELNNSYNGLIRTSGRLYPELKSLSKEALASGEAIDIIAKKVEGSAAEAMKTGAGSVQAYNNAVGDLKKTIGEAWENSIKGARVALTNLLNWYNAGIRGIMDAISLPGTLRASERYVQSIDEEIKAAENKYKGLGEWQRLKMLGIQAEKDGNDALAEAYMRQRRLIEESARDEVNALEEKKRASSQYMSILEDKIRMLEVLYDMENGGKVGEDFSHADKKKAETYKKNYEKAMGQKLNIDMLYYNVLNKIEEAQAAQERKRQAAIAGANQNIAEDREASAKKLIEENQKALDAEIEKIKRKAELEGKDINSVEVEKQILDARTNAYENLLTAAKDYLDVVDGEGNLLINQRALLDNLKDQLKTHREIAEKTQWEAELDKKRLSELANRQSELASLFNKIFDDVKGDAKRQTELAREKDYQEQVEKLKKISLEKAAEFEKRVARSKATELAELRKKELQENLTEQDQALTRLMQAEMDKYREGHPARTAIENEFNEKKKKLAEDTADTIVQIEANLDTEIRNINAGTYDYLETREDALLQKRLQNIREFLSASQQIAGSISATWTNIVDYQIESELKKNNEAIKSDEERAQKEKEIMIESANRRYKAELFAWSANVTMASATAALAALEAYKNGWGNPGAAGGITAGIQMALAIATGAMQIAAVASAMPKPPRFHSGGEIYGRAGQEVPLIGMVGEHVYTGMDHQNVMKVLANAANGKGGGATVVQPKVTVNNTISDRADVTTGFNLEDVIITITNKAMGEGRLNDGFAMRDQDIRGSEFL